MTTVTALVDQSDYAATLAALAAARADAAQWRARYMAAHDVLLAVEDYVDSSVLVTGKTYSMDGSKFFAMRAAFFAYRASIEAGAPVGWAVAEGEQHYTESAEEGRENTEKSNHD